MTTLTASILTLCLGAASAQTSTHSGKLDPIRLLIVGGQVQQAEVKLKALAGSGNVQERSEAWKELAALYEKQGRDEDRVACLDAIAALGGDLATWAQQEKEKVAAAQGRPDEPAGDPVRRLIKRLDEGSTNDLRVKAAYESLSSLGVLMVPSLLAELDDLGPFGLQNAQKLLGRYPSKDLTAIAERYLVDEDPNRQLFAANLLDDLPVDDRRRLVAKALESSRDQVRYEAVQALSGIGTEPLRLLTEVQKAMTVASPQLRYRYVHMLREFDPPYPEGLFPFLEKCFGDVEASVRNAAVETWVRLMPEDAEDQALALYRKLDPAGRELLLDRVLSRRKPWPTLLFEALTQARDEDDVRKIIGGLQRSKVRLDVAQCRRLLALDDQYGWSLVQQQLMAQPDMTGKLPELVDLLDHPDQNRRMMARNMLQRDAGHGLLLARIRELPGLGFNEADILQVLQRSGRPEHVPDMLWLYRTFEDWDETLQNGLHYLDETAKLIARQFLPEHFPLLAQLIEVRGPAVPSAKQVRQRANLAYACIRKDGLGEAQLATALDLARKGWSEARIRDVAQAFLAAVDSWAGDASEGAVLEALAAERAAMGQHPERVELARGLVRCLDKMTGQAGRKVLLGLLDDEELAYVAGQALFARKDVAEKAVAEAALASPRHRDLLQLVLQRKVAAEDEELRKALVERLTELPPGAEVPDSLTTFLYSLPSTSRGDVCVALAAKQGLAGRSELLHPVLQIIGDAKEARNIDFLGRFLKHGDPAIRELAVSGIGRTFDEKAIPFLLEALKDDYNQVSGEARNRLARLSQYLQEVEDWNRRLKGEAKERWEKDGGAGKDQGKDQGKQE
ncbi:MAG: HEAT repeat domain-containing protein [Planctomycetota bacterium]